MRNFVLAGLVLIAISAAAQQGARPAADPNRAVLERYCFSCHNQRLKIAGLALDTLDFAHPEKDALTWERAIRKLRGGMMPPPGAPRPTTQEAAAVAAYLETALDRAAAAHPNPGSVRMHRLNRAEYANAARDLFGVEIDASALLPADDISDGFDNIARVLKVSPSFLDQYLLAARAVVKQAIGAPFTGQQMRLQLRGVDPAAPLPPGARAGISARFLAPAEGEYELRAPGNFDIFLIDGQPVDPRGRTHLTAGDHTVVAASAGRSLIDNEGVLHGFAPGLSGTGYGSTGTQNTGAAGGGGRGGRAGGPAITVTGPFNPTGPVVEPESRQRIFLCRPPDEREETACATRILANLARRAYRRPVTEADLAPLLRFFAEGRKAGGFEAGIESALVAMLSSTKYLYRTLTPPPGARPGSVFPLTPIELASRLSFFLWSSIPDDQLLTLAEQGRLRDPQVLEQQVRRMLADPRSSTLVSNFAFQWLKLREMETIDPDPYVYPEFDEALRAAFRTEMRMFLDSVFREDRPVTELLGANYTFVNERLAMHYGIPNIRGDKFRRVTLADESRWGLMGKGAVLLVTAYPNRTSPVLRGAYILERVLGTPPAPPPPNVEAFQENKEGEKPKTIRQIMELHRANPTCNSCHGVMDPLGFALENFDTVATYRTLDKYTRTKIDTAGTLVDGTVINGPADLRKALLARGDQFAQTLTEKLMMYALGRGLEPFDMPTVRQIVREAKRDNFKFSSIVLGIVKSPAFQSSVVETEPAAHGAAE
jgi:mono/diheme cytochrome c family protein